MVKEKKIQDETLKTIDNQTRKFEIGHVELDGIAMNCRALKDFLYTPISNLRKFQKNIRIITDTLVRVGEEGSILNDRQAEINKKLEIEMAGELSNSEYKISDELKKLSDDNKAEILKFNKTKWEVHLYTMNESDFPVNEPDKFSVKTFNISENKTIEIYTGTAVAELMDTIIIEGK